MNGIKEKEKLEEVLANSKLKLLDNGKYIEPNEVCQIGKRELKRKKIQEKSKTKGSNWFNIGAPEICENRQNDFQALKNRSSLESKIFYKRNNITENPKYFQIGRVVELNEDYFSSRLTKKQRKQTLAEELTSELENQVSNQIKTKSTK